MYMIMLSQHLLIECIHGIILALTIPPWLGKVRVSAPVDGIVRDKAICTTDSHVENEVELKKYIDE